MGPTIIAALTSAGSVAIISAIIQALMGRKKISAEAAKIIDQAASSAVERSEKEIKRMETRLLDAEGKIRDMGTEMSQMRDEMRNKDQRVGDLENQVEDLTEEIYLLRTYADELRKEMLVRDPGNPPPPPPPRIAKHFRAHDRIDRERLEQEGRTGSTENSI